MLIMRTGFLACFSRHISRTQSFQQNRHITFLALVALKLLVSLISRLVACSPRIVVHTHTHTQTHRTTTVTLAAHARRGLIKFDVKKRYASASSAFFKHNTSVYITAPKGNVAVYKVLNLEM